MCAAFRVLVICARIRFVVVYRGRLGRGFGDANEWPGKLLSRGWGYEYKVLGSDVVGDRKDSGAGYLV